ncbi:MAG: anaerobic C4-dicarboxylate transporter [Bdellovibrionales bacterium]|nr:anaerobic C4-dicarboxylate transporter [Bdellovibrionales bacterium]
MPIVSASGLEIVLQGLIVLGCLGIGSRMGGVAVGLWGGVGVFLLSTLFHLSPGDLPVAAMTIIFAVVTAAGAMQVAGGIDYLVGIAHRILKSKPAYITYLAPYVSWIFTIGAGTGNVYYSLLPVIEEVAYQNRVRPERPLALSPEASQLGITSSPVSAAMAIMIGFLAPLNFGLKDILMIVLPSTMVSIFVAAFIQNRRGKELMDDPIYLARLQDGTLKKPSFKEPENATISKRAKLGTWMFLIGIIIVVVFGFLPSLRPQIHAAQDTLKPMAMTKLIAVVMMLIGIMIMFIGKVNPAKIPETSVFRSGMVSVLALMGIAWMANTFVGAHEKLLSTLMQEQVSAYIWLLPVAFYVTAALTTSQSSTTLIIAPVAIAIGIAPAYIVASWLAVIGIHFFPASGSQIATIQFDRSGTTRIGRWVLNHSFLVPNLIVAGTSVVFGFMIARVIF